MNTKDWIRKFGSRGEIEATIRFKGEAETLIMPLAFILECPKAPHTLCWFTTDHVITVADKEIIYWHFITEWTERQVDSSGYLELETNVHDISFNTNRSTYSPRSVEAFFRWREVLNARSMTDQQVRNALAEQIADYR